MTSLIQATHGAPKLVEDIYKYQAFGRVIITIKQESEKVSLRGETLPKNKVEKYFTEKVKLPP